MIIDRVCIRRSVATDNVPEVTLDVICDSEGMEAVWSGNDDRPDYMNKNIDIVAHTMVDALIRGYEK